MSSDRPTHLVVGNPTAQSGKNAERIARALEYLEARGVACEVCPTLPDGGTIPAVRDALDQGAHHVVITMGGDGTFREVAAALCESVRREEVALGMLPTGTANDQGKSFGLEAGEAALERNLEVVLAGKETRLDAGVLENLDEDGHTLRRVRFFDSAGWGISARVLATRNEDRTLVASVPILRDLCRDHLVYAGAFLRTFLESYVTTDKFDALVETEDGTTLLAGLTDLVVKATRVYGGAWVFDKTSKHDDGLFEIIPFRGKRDWVSKGIVDLDGNPLTEERLNVIGVSHSKPLRARSMRFRFRAADGGAELAAQIDGEELEARPDVRVTVEPRAIRLLVP